MTSLYDIPLQTLQEKSTTLAPYQGKVLLIVNVASLCGFTPQYKNLEALYQDYHARGLMVLGFPCNQFNQQEPGSSQDILEFTHSCYRVTFPLFAKINVKGEHQSSLYAYLAAHLVKKPLKFVPWNFTKILIDRHGIVLKQFYPTSSFKTLRKTIDNLI